MMTLPDREWLCVNEVAEYFSVHHGTVRAWIKSNKLPSKKVLGVRRINREAVMELISKK